MARTKLELESLEEHPRILKRPGMYMGSLEALKKRYRILDVNSGVVKTKEFLVSSGLERLEIESISNAGDNVIRSRQYKVDSGIIKCDVSGKIMCIYNTGKTFEIEKFKGTDKYKQEIAFGKIGSSTNYNDDMRDSVSGTNGVGVKLVNIYSKKFILNVGDSINKKLYTQTWENNMFEVGEPVIVEYKDGESFVKVKFEVDFDRFDPIYKNGYNEDIINLFAMNCANMSFTNKVPVYFNGVKLEYFNIIEYINFLNNQAEFKKKYITYASAGTSKHKIGVNEVVTVPNQKIEICIYDTPDKGEIISFVNGIITREGGVHVNSVMNRIKDYILKEINKDKKDTKYKLTLRDLRPHISIVMSCFVKAPKYKSQMKESLNSPEPIINISDKELSSMLEWDLIDRLESAINAKMYKVLAKTDGNKRGMIRDPNVDDATKAGTKESHKCTLYVTEGLSAKNYALRMFKHMNGGKGIGKYNGAFPLKGKPLNVMNIDTSTPEGIEKLNDNDEYVGLKKILGLKEGMIFNTLKDLKKLRYGSVVILADSDPDGKHIVGLGLTIFFDRFLSLLKLGFVKMHRTPTLRAFKGRQHRSFFILGTFKKWLKKNPKGWRIDYYKGLGSSSEKEVKMDVDDNSIENKSTINLIYTPNSSNAMNVAFGSDSSLRKEWIEAYEDYEGIENIKNLKIEDFINKEMIEHSMVNNARTIPGMDGLKESQRKVMYTALHKWKNGEYKIKSGDIVNRTQTFTKYQYGPKSLVEAVNKMALNYPGSNNMAYFGQEGMFGTRLAGGKDAAAERYTSVSKMWWWEYIFKPNDAIIYKYIKLEGKKCEPASLWPIVPMFMINGAWGTGTGWSTFIPNYNPLDVCNYIISIIKNEKRKTMIPWYRGFKGTIKVTVNISNGNTDDKKLGVTKNILEPDIIDYDTDSMIKRRMVTKGVLEYKRDSVVIKEIPIGDNVLKYKKFLDAEMDEGRISYYENNSEDENVEITIKGHKNSNYKNLKLIRRFGMTNMTIQDENGKIKTYRTVDGLLDYWFKWRLSGYEKRIKLMLISKNDHMKELSDQIKFIRLVLAGYDIKKKISKKTIIIVKETTESIKDQMEECELDFDIYKKTPLSGISKEGIDKAESAYDKLKADMEYLKNTKAQDIWLQEINAFVKEYKKVMSKAKRVADKKFKK